MVRLRAEIRRRREKLNPRRAIAAIANASQASLSRLLRRPITEAGAATPACDPSAIHFSSAATSCADCHRSSGSFAREIRTARSRAGGDIGRIVEIAGGSSVMIDEITEAWLFPSKAFRPL